MKKTLVGLVIVVVLAALAFPALNLVIKPDNGGKVAAIRDTDSAFTPVAAVLEAKCAGCHLPDAALPFYADFPLASGMIEKDIDLGQRFFDFEADLGTAAPPVPEVTLAKLEYVTEQGSMPPGRYKALHWDSGLREGEVQRLLDWVRQVRLAHYATGTADERFAAEVVQPLVPVRGLDPEMVALGNKLYHDTALSGDGTISCATCHDLATGGTDRLQFSTGIRGQKGGINSPTVYNAVYAIDQFWDGRAGGLREQAAGPVANPIEMGAEWPAVVEKLKAMPEYVAAFDELFDGALTAHNVQVAIAAFESTLVTPGSRFDKYLMGDEGAINASEKEGYALFKSNGCAGCHAGQILGGQSYEHMGRAADYFADRGNVGEADQGRFNHTKSEGDRHRFKVPTLRNVAVTYPYFHDGSTEDLAAAVGTMAKYNCGEALGEPDAEKIVAFLNTLTGEYDGKLLQ